MSKFHKTARARKKPSALANVALALKEELGFSSILDWGCGRGADVQVYLESDLDAEGYDPVSAPQRPDRRFDMGTCAYVLNVIKSPEARVGVLQDLCRHIVPGGYVLLCARSPRDVEYEATTRAWITDGDGYITGSGSFQAGLHRDVISAYVQEAGLRVVKSKANWVLAQKDE